MFSLFFSPFSRPFFSGERPGVFSSGPDVWRPNFIFKFFKKRNVYTTLSGVLIVAILFGFWSLAGGETDRWEGEVRTYAVASAVISPGQEVAEFVSYLQRPASLVPANAIWIQDLENGQAALTGIIAKSHIYAGEVLTQDRLVREELALGEALAIPVRVEERPPLAAGDRVNLVATSLEPEIKSLTIVREALVFSVDDRSVSVIVDPEEVQLLVSALITQNITLIRVS